MSPDSSRYAKWAEKRLETERASNLSTADIAGTEWPLFGSVFFLWATESLQQAWEEDHSLSATPPREYASDAIDAAVGIITDPAHASWVKAHWGDDYLNRENVFYRMLLTQKTVYPTGRPAAAAIPTYVSLLRNCGRHRHRSGMTFMKGISGRKDR